MRLKTILFLLTAAVAFSSCDAIYDDEGDCNTYCNIKFVYDYNMTFADAFAAQVERVDLYVFDDNGLFVMQSSESGDALKADGYRMPLDIEPGSYTVVAWCGLQGALASYSVPEMTPGQSTVQELKCLLADRTEAEGETRVGEIDRLFHGMASFTLPDEYGDHTYNVRLTKNTNTVRIVLQNTSEDVLDKDDFVFTITDENGLLDYDNTLLADQLLTYHPYYVTQGSADVNSDSRAVTAVNAVVAELNVSRLYIDKNTRPMLTITKAQPEADGSHETVLSIPLIDYVLLVKGYYNREMSDQEYLDRQDEYNMTFFLDDNSNWLSSSIIINSWRVVLSDAEL